MDMRKELKGKQEALVVANLAVAYTLLALAPWDNWGHEGSPAEMAVFVVEQAKQNGRLGFVERALLNRGNGYGEGNYFA